MASPLRESLLSGDPPPPAPVSRANGRPRISNGHPINSPARPAPPTPGSARSPSPPPPSRSALLIFLHAHLPILRWLPGYSLRVDLIGDVLAGLTVGLMVVPQAMAYAQIAKLPVLTGLYSALVGCVLYTPFGTAKDLNVGPTSVLSLLVLASYLPPATKDGDAGLPARLSQAFFLALYAGVWQLVFGFLRLGRVLDFISHPVISAFTSASALTIASVQIHNLTGITVGATFLTNVTLTVTNAHMFLWRDALLGAACIGLLTALSRLKRHRREERFVLWFLCTARNALTVMAASLLSLAFMLSGYEPFVTIPIIDGSTPHLPSFSAAFLSDPVVTSSSNLLSWTFSAVAIACIGILEGIAVARSFAKQNGYSHVLNPSQELISTGVVQSVGAFLGCYPVGGSFSRTAVNSQAGMRTPMGGLFAGLVLLLALLFATPMFHYIPQASLAAVIICAVFSIIDFDIFVRLYRLGEPRPYRAMPRRLGYAVDWVLVVLGGWVYVPLCLWRRRGSSPAPQAWWDLLTLLVAFWGCLLIDIEWGIALAVVVSLGLAVLRASEPGVRRLWWKRGAWREEGEEDGEDEEDVRLTRSSSEAPEGDEWVNEEVLCVRVQGNVMYFSVNAILQQLRQHEERAFLQRTFHSPHSDDDAKDDDEVEEEEEDEDEEGEAGERTGKPVLLGPPESLTALREVEEGLESVALEGASSRLRWVMVDLVAVSDCDTSGMHGLEAVVKEYRGRRDGAEVEVVWVNAQESVQRFLIRAWQEAGLALVGGDDEVRSWFAPHLTDGMERIRRWRDERLEKPPSDLRSP